MNCCNELRLREVQDELENRETTIEEELHKAFKKIYEDVIPQDRRFELENKIQKIEEAERAELEAGKRFAVYHLHDADDDYHFIDETRNTFFGAASAYQRLRESGNNNYSIDSIAHAYFGDHQDINEITFSVLCDAMDNDKRVTAIMEFDFEENKVSVREGANSPWVVHDLDDVFNAARTANAVRRRHLFEKVQLFNENLAAYEIVNQSDVSTGEEESTGQTISM